MLLNGAYRTSLPKIQFSPIFTVSQLTIIKGRNVKILPTLLIILFLTDSEPDCSSNTLYKNTMTMREQETLEMSCSVNYSGNWAPVMKWQQVGGPVITDGRVVNNTVPYKSVTYSFTVRATRDMNGSKFSCTTHFSSNNRPPSTAATNVPDYELIWTSHVLVVKCKFILYVILVKIKQNKFVRQPNHKINFMTGYLNLCPVFGLKHGEKVNDAFENAGDYFNV